MRNQILMISLMKIELEERKMTMGCITSDHMKQRKR